MELELTLSNGKKKTFISNAIEKVIENKVDKKFLYAKNKFLKDFLSHPVSKEIINGASDPTGAKNISNTLGGYGNLYTFFGFDTPDPVGELYEIFDEYITIKLKRKQKNALVYTVSFPDKNSLQELTSIEWLGGRSWLYVIEEGGNFGLNYYLNKPFANSRAGAQQLHGKKAPFSRGGFRNRSYFTELKNQFVENIKK